MSPQLRKISRMTAGLSCARRTWTRAFSCWRLPTDRCSAFCC